MIQITASVMTISMYQSLNEKLDTEPCGIAVTLSLAYEDAWLESNLVYQLS